LALKTNAEKSVQSRTAEPLEKDGPWLAVTSDSQLALGVAIGLIGAQTRYNSRGIANPIAMINSSLLSYLEFQTRRPKVDDLDGPLFFTDVIIYDFAEKMLWREFDRFVKRGEDRGLNHSGSSKFDLKMSQESARIKGFDSRYDSCPTAMVGPIGLFVVKDRVLEMAAETICLSYHLDLAVLSAGAYALTVSELAHQESGSVSLLKAVTLAVKSLKKSNDRKTASEFMFLPKEPLRISKHPKAGLFYGALKTAIKLAKDPKIALDLAIARLTYEDKTLDVLVKSLYLALTAESYQEGVSRAVSLQGDAGAYGTLTGQLLGLIYGLEGLPNNWLEHLEAREFIANVAEDLDKAPDEDPDQDIESDERIILHYDYYL
jgi:ADP-ribosylglycohydrolase